MTAAAHAQLLRVMAAENARAAKAADGKQRMCRENAARASLSGVNRDAYVRRAESAAQDAAHYRERQAALEAGAAALQGAP